MSYAEHLNKKTYKEFMQLSHEQQDSLIYKYGKWLAQRKEEKYDVKLWVLWDFYTEIFYKKDCTYIEKILVHNNDKVLDRYKEYQH
jgi:hypothetical protein